jgi:hypothetical protein
MDQAYKVDDGVTDMLRKTSLLEAGGFVCCAFQASEVSNMEA